VAQSALELAREVLRLRVSMLTLNEAIKAKTFKVPVHLALGHESLAVAVSAMMQPGDVLACSHRNLHYNLARGATLAQARDEFALMPTGLAGGTGGSMNLSNPAAGIVYTSSILGNNMAVATGLALGKKVKGEAGLTIVVTGDGAMEEGTLYESLQMYGTFELPAMIVVENNGWSLATRIEERRCPIRLDLLAQALGADYLLLEGNDPEDYLQKLRAARTAALANNRAVVVEAKLSTLGDWRMPTPEFPDGKYINYHAGGSPSVCIDNGPCIRPEDDDPVHVLSRKHGAEALAALAQDVQRSLGEVQA
jgi:pyruvate dehydrogenase E1 component alpha subunit